MGWMHDTLNYVALDPIYRKYHHGELTFRMLYAFNENFMLPLSHDEVVHGKGSMLDKMPGDEWQRFANLRLLYGYMFSQPGKKLLFMGSEFGQWSEWNHDVSLDWSLTQFAPHEGLMRWVGDLNRLYRSQPGLHAGDCDPSGFLWLDANDYEQSVISFLRLGPPGTKPVLVICNFTPQLRRHYRIGAPSAGYWREILNSDAECYGGSGQGNLGGVAAEPLASHGQPASLTLTLPPLAVVFLSPE
jgi:1,4-alpha-glucan branching enzyme